MYSRAVCRYAHTSNRRGRWHDGGVRLTVRVRPGASRTRVGGRYGAEEVLVVCVAQRAVDGAATAAVCRAVAASFGLRTREVTLVAGATARTKVLDLDVPDHAAAQARLTELLDGAP